MQIETLPMQMRRGYIAPETKILFKCSETSGLNMYDSVSKIRYNPLITTTNQDAIDFWGPAFGDGFLRFDIPNAIRIQNDDSKLPTFIDVSKINFDARKVIIFAAVTINREQTLGDGNQTRVAFGVAGYGNVMTNSMQLNMHISFSASSLPDESDLETMSLRSTDQPGGGMNVPADTLGVVYAVWDGPNGTLQGKFLNLDGSVYNDGSQDFVLTINQPLTNGQTNLVMGDMSRFTNGDYYSIAAAQYDKVPNMLDEKLAQWGAECVKGHKGWPDLF